MVLYLVDLANPKIGLNLIQTACSAGTLMQKKPGLATRLS
tara:strand:+ start:448 stop:567 length:120 start_codon:yes stop_codon:yes gene_type:complete